MVLTYGFYNSVNGDRTYDAEDFSRFFDGIINDGVIPGVGQEFETTADGTSVIVGSGRAWFNNTWSYNDAPVSLELPTTSNINNRVDYLVLEVDTRSANRENKFIFVMGSPSVSPAPPVLNPPEGVYHHPLYRIYRRRDVNEIRPQDVVKLVGTDLCPYATNALTDIQQWNNLTYKRSIVRGNNLGSTFTPAQRAAVRNGSFEDMYLGDYWTYAGVRWRIVDFDYFMQFGQGTYNTLSVTANTTAIRDHHLVIVPDDVRPLYANQTPFVDANPKKASNCGMEFSTRVRTRLDNIATRLGGMVGMGNLLTPRVFFPSTFSATNMAMNRQVRFFRGIPMTEPMLSGGRTLGLRYSSPYNDQYALYKHGVRWFWSRYEPNGADPGSVWLAEQYNIDTWVIYQGWLGPSTANPRTHANSQVRPAMAVAGKV